ncbi:cell division ATP-binding protein FtsE [Alkalibacterium iburiense]|uniref:Cell division ATP-binding protein FtsE n=1 Tax=Alkalibacterium iburiense TaxID=290589 RepID=A0ABN0XEJ7_9LACT
MIRLKDVSKTYKKETHALVDVSLSVEQNEFVYIVGKSGSGKTTLIDLLYGKVKPNKGIVAVEEYFVNHLKSKHLCYLRRKLGVVFQDFRLLEHKTLFENIAYVLEVTGHHPSDIESKVMDALDTVNLKHKALDYPSDCSGGEQQRVAIARAIVHEPAVLIADEPTANLDPRTGFDMVKLLHKINQRGTAVIMATHNYSYIDRLPARVIELENGRVISDRSKNHVQLIINAKYGDFYVG